MMGARVHDAPRDGLGRRRGCPSYYCTRPFLINPLRRHPVRACTAIHTAVVTTPPQPPAATAVS
jgi:hypothetical protein